MTDQKKDLRREMNRKRRALSAQQREAAGKLAAERLLALPCWKRSTSVFAYSDYNGELPTEQILQKALEEGKILALPRITAPGQMEFHALACLQERVAGSYGILEPDGEKEIVIPDTQSLLLLPATAFDEEGNRLGYGGGFYDRYCRRFPQAIRIGLAYEFQVVLKVPRAEFDIPVQGIVTEAQTRLFRDGKGCKIDSFPL